MASCFSAVPSRVCAGRVKKQAGAQTNCSCAEQHLSMAASHSVAVCEAMSSVSQGP